MSYYEWPDVPLHYEDCPEHEDFEPRDHTEDCDAKIFIGAYCSCGYDDIPTECICEELHESYRDYASDMKFDFERENL